MNKKSLIFGVIATLIWFLGIYVFSQSNSYNLPATLNELCDFLAGIFAPIAFFWLILGYIQQGKQLDQNTKALEQQEKALQLQIDEMKEGVKQQAELVNIQKTQYEEQQNLLEPRFIISDAEVFNVLGREVEKMNEEEKKGKQLFIDPEMCINCGACIPECPEDAIYRDEKEAIDMGDEESVHKNYEFYGYTFSKKN